MPASIIGSSSSPAPTQGEVIIPVFAPNAADGFSYTNIFWYMEHGWESIGATEDEMTFRVQAVDVTNTAFNVILNPDGPLATIKFDTPVIGVRRFEDSNGKDQYEIVFAGFVKGIRQVSNSNEQYCQVTATSVKKCLRDVRIRGSYCWDGAKVVYRDSIPLHMNHGGRPDWTFSDDGVPMPAPNPDWGLDAESEPPTADDQSSTQATYCTLGMLINYLIAVYGTNGDSTMIEDARDLAQGFYTGLDRIPTGFPFDFVWPPTFGQEVDQFIVANFNNATGQNNTTEGGARKGRDIRFKQGQPLISNAAEIGVLDTIFAECGAFNYALGYDHPDNQDGSVGVTLKCVPTRVVSAISTQALYYAGGKESSVGSHPVVREIDYTESNGGTYTRLIGVSSSIKIETRIDTSGDAFDLSDSTTGCKYGFTPDEFDAWRLDSVVAGNTSEELMYTALKNYPHLLSRFLLEPTYDFTAGTDFADYPRSSAPRSIWPFLLSYQGVNIATQANDIVPYPVRFEVSTDGGTMWVDSHVESDGFVSWDNGYFEALAFRDIGINRNDTPENSGRTGMFTWGNGNDNGKDDGAWGGVKAGLLNVTINDIRCTVAIPHDVTLNYSMKTPADATIKGDEQLYVNAPDSPDAIRFDPRFTRTMIVDLNRLYDLWLRWSSYPVPQSAGGVEFEDRPGLEDAVRNNLPLLIQDTNKRLYERNRLQRSGFFKFIGPLLPPQVYPLGQQLSFIGPIDPTSDISPFPLNCCVQRKVWSTKNMGTAIAPKWSSSTEIVPI